MLSGRRWQLILLLAAAAVFAVAVVSRVNRPAPPPTATPRASDTPSAAAVPTDEGTPLPIPDPTSIPTPAILALASSDGVPTYREGLVGQVQRLNPLFATLNPVDADITALIFEGLTTINAFGEPVPALAENWIVSSNGLEYVFTLRNDIVWHDGTPFDAADVAFTMSLLRHRDFPGDRALRDFWRTVETQQLNDRQIRFRLTQPLGAFPYALRIGILPEHVFVGMPIEALVSHPFNFTPIGTGPYQLEALRGTSGQIEQVDLRVAPNYALRQGADIPTIDRFSFRLYVTFDEALAGLDAGEIDGLATRSRQERVPLQDRAVSGSVVLRNAIEPTLGAVIFNWQRETTRFFTEERVRRALLLGTDRRRLVERTALFQQAVFAEGPLVPGGWAFDPSLSTPYDMTQAQFLLSEARLDQFVPEEAEGETPTPDGPLGFVLLVAQDPVLEPVAEQIAAQWTALGFAVDVQVLPVDELQERLDAGLFDAALVELTQLGTADPDVYDFWHDAEYPDGKNYGGVSDRVISELLERARREPNALNRKNLYFDFQREFLARAVAVPLYYPLYSYATSTRVENVQLGYLGKASDRFVSIADWHLAN
ncbi:MAG: peptide ABC transporter substrate-binding protein [Chloroflexi bacterium]|nr:peptide ABC transporter substrate-binding protein [Chloroflexota bacterium]